MNKILILLTVFILSASGCVTTSQTASVDEIKAATEALKLQAGTEMLIAQTLLGIDGKIIDFFGGESAERRVIMTDYVAGDRAVLKWSMRSQVETQASVDARQAYEAKYKDAPIGTEIPAKLKPIFETKTREGKLSSISLLNAHSILLPVAWREGDEGIKPDNALIWISTEQYDQLVSSKKTVLNLGLFDDSIASALDISDQVRNFINALKKDSEKISEKEELLTITAEPNWGTFMLLMDGKEQTVQTIEASNWFGHYTILANRENPLILEVILSPASKGSLNIFSREKFLHAFAGYHVTEIKNKQP